MMGCVRRGPGNQVCNLHHGGAGGGIRTAQKNAKNFEGERLWETPYRDSRKGILGDGEGELIIFF